MPQGRAEQSVGNGRFDFLLTLRAPVAVDNMFGHHRLEVLRNVFDIAWRVRSGSEYRRNWDNGRPDVLRGIYMFGRRLWTANSHMPLLAAPLLFSLARGTGLEMWRFHPGGSGVRLLLEAGLPRGAISAIAQREHDRFFALSEDFARLLLGKRRPQW